LTINEKNKKSFQRSLEWRNELDLYKSGLKVCPNNAKIHYNIAKIMADNGDISRATINYANAISITYNSIFISATMHNRSLEWRNELDLYKSGLKVCPNNAKIHYNIAKIMADNGDISRATVNYANAIRLNPTYENAMNNLANIYLKYDRNLEAEQLLRKAIKIRPNFAAAWMNLGLAQLAQKRYKVSHFIFDT
uniref:TPR_REGION domain-containing protein n=1 Tax=Brugia pahangi TaxID=6280 RepID=A0A0N4TBI5_BRUPA